jgi:hypothetical protein
MGVRAPWHVGEINLPVLYGIGDLPLIPGRGEGLVARIITPNCVLEGLPDYYTLKDAFDQRQVAFYSQVTVLM